MVKRNNYNNERESDNSSKKKSNRIRKLWYGLAIFLWLLGNPEKVNSQSFKDGAKEQTEQVTKYDMISNIQQKTWVNLPSEYEERVRNFINYCDIFKDRDVREFTENFIIDEMEKDRWYEIDKSKKMFFIYSWMSIPIAHEDIYDWEDGNEEMLEIFEHVVDKIDDCWERYVKWLMEHMKTISLEAKQQSEEYKQQSEEYKQQSEEYKQQSGKYKQQSEEYKQQSGKYKQQSEEYKQQSEEYKQQSGKYKQQSEEYKQQSEEYKQRILQSTSNTLKEIVAIYEAYKKNSNTAKPEEIAEVKKITKETIETCKQYWIDYKSIILEKVWDKKIVNEILRFYEIE